MKIDVCLSPDLLQGFPEKDSIVVIIDVFRATSSVCTAFANGVERIIPVAEIEEAREYKMQGYIVAGERDGLKLDFADIGNSPFNFSKENVSGKGVVYTTTNGTKTMHLSSAYSMSLIGSFLNAGAIVDFLKGSGKNVLLLCAGWKGLVNLEDTVCAGMIASNLLGTGLFTTVCDSTLASVDLWLAAKNDLRSYLEKAAQRARLKANGLDDCIDYCLRISVIDVIPVLRDGILVELERQNTSGLS